MPSTARTLDQDRRALHEEYASPVERVTDTTRIAKLLMQLHADRSLLTVGLSGIGQLYTSSLLDIGPQQEYLTLDELNPHAGHAQLLNAKKAWISARLRGVEVDFTTELLEVGGQTKIAYYRMTLPRLLHYRQRRAYYRVQVGTGHSIPVLMKRAHETLGGELWDISVGGMSVRLPHSGAAPHPIQQGEILDSCRINLDPITEIASKLEVRFVSYDEGLGALRIGGRFVDLTKSHQHTLERFVASVDRTLRKRVKG